MRTSLRRLRRHPGSTLLVAFVTFAAATCLGGGYLLMDAVLWRVLPGMPDARTLVVTSFPARTGSRTPVPLAFFDDLAAAAGGGPWCPFSFGSLSKVTHDGTTSQRPVSAWMPSCGSVLRVQPVLGRFWADGEPNAHRAVVISERFWEREFGRSPAVLGQPLSIDDLPAEIIGVAPRSFMGLSVEIAPDIFMPLNFRTGQLMSDGRPVVFRYLVGRVDDAPPPALDRVLRDRLTHLLDSRSVPLSDALRAALLSAEVSVDATGRGFSYLRDGYRDPVRGLTFIGVVLLAMALCNIAGLSYSQTRRREREFMVREVLGADVWQQARLLSAELLWPVGTGLAVALPCAVVLAGTLAQLLWVSQTPNSLVLEFRPITVAAFTAIGVALTAAALASAMWARRSIARGGPLPLKAFHHSRAGVLLSASQCAVSVAAMFVAGILVHGVWNLVHVELGFNRERLVFARLLPARTGPPAPDQHVHYQRLVDEIRATPGIAEVALAAAFPRQVGGSVRADLAGTPMTVSYDVVSDEFFDVTGIGLRAGRLFQPSDSPQTDAVAILTEGLARALFPDDAALGRQVHFGQPERPLTVVGIVGDVRLAGPRQPVVPTIYTVRRQQPNLNPVVVARTVASSATMVAPLTDIINRAGRDYPVGMLTIENDLRRALAPERTLQLLSWVLGALVMMLVAIGLIAQQVTWSAGQRRSTVLRMVLGESTRGVMVRTARRALGIVAAGTAAGVPMALAAGAVLNRVLPGFDAGNPWLLAAVATVVLFGGTVASYWPTRFLAKLNPSDALRLEH